MESADKALPYNYLGVQALPPRKKGRDRRRLNKALNRTEEEDDMSAAVVEEPVTVSMILSVPLWRSRHVGML